MKVSGVSTLRSWPAAILLSLFLAGCATTGPPGQIFVRVLPPIRVGGWPPERLVLEVGGRAWQIEQENGGGLVNYEGASNPEPVRLLDPARCEVLYRFDALVGHKYTLKVSADGSLTLLDETQSAYEYGPALAETNPSGC